MADRADSRRLGGDECIGREAGDELDDLARQYRNISGPGGSADCLLLFRMAGLEGEEKGREVQRRD